MTVLGHVGSVAAGAVDGKGEDFAVFGQAVQHWWSRCHR